jgi:hypothetical protein
LEVHSRTGEHTEFGKVGLSFFYANFQHFPHAARPLLRTMQHAQNFDARTFDAVRDNERRSFDFSYHVDQP